MRSDRLTIVAVEKAISITYSECLPVALVIQHAVRMRRIVICGLFGCTYFSPHYLLNGTIFERKKLSEHFSTTFV
jgi:hypothetical protein